MPQLDFSYYEDKGCWIPILRPGPSGYVYISRAGKSYKLTRWVWNLVHGVFPTKSVLHSCDRPNCCNPAHLWLGTQKENMQDKAKKGRVPNAVLVAEQVKEIRAAWKNRKATQAELGFKYGISQAAISAVVRRKSYEWVE